MEAGLTHEIKIKKLATEAGEVVQTKLNLKWRLSVAKARLLIDIKRLAIRISYLMFHGSCGDICVLPPFPLCEVSPYHNGLKWRHQTTALTFHKCPINLIMVLRRLHLLTSSL